MNSSKPAFIATVLVALLAIGAAIFAYINVVRNEPENGYTPYEPTDYSPPKELEDEMLAAAKLLIENNVAVSELYIFYGLPVISEPYANQDKPLGNPPEDGLFYVNGNSAVHDKYYKTLADVENIVRETYVPDEAVRIINNRLDNGDAYYSGYGAIYSEKRANSSGFSLGINEAFVLDFHPYPRQNTDSAIDWLGATFTLEFVSDTESILKIHIKRNGEDGVANGRMFYVQGEGWRLDRLIYERK